VSFTDTSKARRDGRANGLEFAITDGKTKTGVGLFAALSLDERATWSTRKLIPNNAASPWNSRLATVRDFGFFGLAFAAPDFGFFSEGFPFRKKSNTSHSSGTFRTPGKPVRDSFDLGLGENSLFFTFCL